MDKTYGWISYRRENKEQSISEKTLNLTTNQGNENLNNIVAFQNHQLDNMSSLRLSSVGKDAEQKNFHSVLLGG